MRRGAARVWAVPRRQGRHHAWRLSGDWRLVAVSAYGAVCGVRVWMCRVVVTQVSGWSIDMKRRPRVQESESESESEIDFKDNADPSDRSRFIRTRGTRLLSASKSTQKTPVLNEMMHFARIGHSFPKE